MKKQALRILSLLLCVMLFVSPLAETAQAASTVAISAVNFPCGNFRKFVKKYDKNNDNKLSSSERSAVKKMDCRNQAITSLTGVEYFTSLTSLDCSNNLLEELDLTANDKLTSLKCGNNFIASLTVGDLDRLVSLECPSNELTGLDLSGCPLLTDLDCSLNSLSSLDLSAQRALTVLDCSSNSLTSLTLENNATLTKLNCSSNDDLTSLDLSQNAALTDLNCSWSPVAPDLSGCAALQKLDCSATGISSLDVGALTSLTELRCSDNTLSGLTLSGNDALTYVDCMFNNLTSLDVSGCTGLKVLWADGNGMTSLETGTIGLEELHLTFNRLSSLTLKNASLTFLECGSNQLSQLDVTGCPALSQLTCSENDLAELDILSCPELLLAVDEGTIEDYGDSILYQYLKNSHYCYLWVDNGVSVAGAVLPVITAHPESVTVYNGEKATFTAEATGGNLRYQWFFRASPQKAWKEIAGKTGPTHTIKTTASRDGYQYMCRVRNRAGIVYTDPATLTVIKFYISSQPTDCAVKAGKKAKFTVKAKGSNLKYQWYYMAPGGEWTLYKKKTKATLTFTAKADKDGYMYRCVVKSGRETLTTDEVTLTLTG